jgi:filamentous hemagglutinin
MAKADHQLTASWGSSNAAKAHRAMQSQLISEGNFAAAQDMDIADVISKSPGVYDDAIQQMLKSSKGLR